MSKKYTPLWYEVHLEINMSHLRTTFRGRDVEKIHAVMARSTFRSQNTKITRVQTTFRDSNIASFRFTTIHYIILHYTPLHTNTLHYTPQHYNNVGCLIVINPTPNFFFNLGGGQDSYNNFCESIAGIMICI